MTDKSPLEQAQARILELEEIVTAMERGKEAAHNRNKALDMLYEEVRQDRDALRAVVETLKREKSAAMTNQEIDARVAREVMGWEVFEGIPYEYHIPFYCDGDITRGDQPFKWERWSPSTDMNAAMEVVEKMRVSWPGFRLNNEGLGHWSALFINPRGTWGYGKAAETPTLAICLAALEDVTE